MEAQKQSDLTNVKSFDLTIYSCKYPVVKHFTTNGVEGAAYPTGISYTENFTTDGLVNFLKYQDNTKAIGTSINKHLDRVAICTTDQLKVAGRTPVAEPFGQVLPLFTKTADNYTIDLDKPGILHIDCDFKSEFDQPWMSPENVIAKLETYIPELAYCDKIVKYSSSNLSNSPDVFPEGGNFHIYVVVPELNRIKILCNYLYQQMHIEGDGFTYVTDSAKIVNHGFIDTAVVDNTSRFVYSGSPIIDSIVGLYYHQRVYAVYGKECHIDLATELRKYNHKNNLTEFNQAIAKINGTPEIQDQYVESKSLCKDTACKRFISEGKTHAEAERLAVNISEHVLLLDHLLHFDNPAIGTITIREAITRNLNFENCGDPIEFYGAVDGYNQKNAGQNKATLINNAEFGWHVSSWIHHKTIYTIDLSEKETAVDPVYEEVSDTEGNEFVSINDIPEPINFSKSQTKSLWKEINLTMEDFEVERGQYDFFIGDQDLPEFVMCDILLDALKRYGKERLKAILDPSMPFNDIMKLYSDKYSMFWNPEKRVVNSKHNFISKSDEKSREKKFKRFAGRLKEKAIVNNASAIVTDNNIEVVGETADVQIAGANNSIGASLKNYMIKQVKDSRKRKIKGHKLISLTYSVERFIAMCFTSPRFVFPMTKDSLTLRSRKKKQAVDALSIYHENQPMHEAIIEAIYSLQEIDLLDVIKNGNKTEIRIKNGLLDLYHMYHRVDDLKIVKECVRWVDNIESKNPVLLEYDNENIEHLNKLRNLIRRYIEKVLQHEVFYTEVVDELNKAMMVVVDLYVQIASIDNPETKMKAFALLPKRDYYFKKNKLTFKRMTLQEMCDAFVTITNIAAVRVEKIRKFRFKESDGKGIKFPSYAQYGIPVLFATGMGGIGIYTNDEGLSVLDKKHPCQMGEIDWWLALE